MSNRTATASRRSDLLHFALGDMARLADVEHSSLAHVLEHLTETSAAALDVARVNIWLYDEARSHIVCLDHFDARTRTHASGETLAAAQYPSYFEALESLRTIAVLDTERDPRTAELRDRYLRPHGITTMLDAPILISGTVAGVACHEHVGPPKEWTGTERLFAGNAADLAALAIQTDRRLMAEHERATLRERLHAMHRLESLGLLAGTVAHDFNNILTIVAGDAELLQAETLGSDARVLVDDIQGAVRRAREICDLLLSYAGRREVAPGRIDLANLAGEMVRLLSRSLPEGVELSLDLNEGPPRVLGDAGQVRQILLNLLTNAVDAVRERGGSVRVRLSRQSYDGVPALPDRDWRDGPGEFAVLEVADDGVGMDADTQRRMFDPCFTTKAGGTGLGLAATQGVLRAHRGAIEVESSPGRGSRLAVWLPAAPTA